MIIFPAIDVKEGKCVRLYQGKFHSAEVVAEDAVTVAKNFQEKGAPYLHMVDLDGALAGESKNLAVIQKVVRQVELPIQLGGGIRSIDTIEKLIGIGISRIILGTSALNNPNMVKEAVQKFKEKIAVGIDAKGGYVAADGWTKLSQINYIDFGRKMEDMGVETLIFTDISKDGTLTGPNIEQLSRLKEKVGCNIIASGGVKNLEDIRKIEEMGLYGVIVGKAIYSGNIDLESLFRKGVSQ